MPRRQPQPSPAALAAFVAAKSEFDRVLAELAAHSAEHFGADPDAVTWSHAEGLRHQLAGLRDLADQLARREEHRA